LTGKIITNRNPKNALAENPIRKSKKREISLLSTATPKGTNINKLRPNTSLPKIFNIVEKSFLSGEIIIISILCSD